MARQAQTPYNLDRYGKAKRAGAFCRKAHLALGEKLNRKGKPPPRLSAAARKSRAAARREIDW
jgi:hypothetical protein